MHSDCMDELAAQVKKLRLKASRRMVAEGRTVWATYDAPGEMRGYLKVLELICPNPMED